jgi:hypothetical protein
LARCVSKPLLSALVRSSDRANAVRAAAGILQIVAAVDWRIRVISSKPSISGIPRSTTRTCGLNASICCNAATVRHGNDVGSGGLQDDPKQYERVRFIVYRQHPNTLQAAEFGEGFQSLGPGMFAARRFRVRLNNH